MPRTIADLMAETLDVAGVQRIYGVVGDSLNGFTAVVVIPGDIALLATDVKAARWLAPKSPIMRSSVAKPGQIA